MALDLSGDWALFDDPVSVTYEAHTAESVYATGVTVAGAQKNEITKKDLDTISATANGLLEKDLTVLHLWAAKLGGIVPKISDRITHGAVKWTVRIVGVRDRDSNGPQRYRCICSKVQG